MDLDNFDEDTSVAFGHIQLKGYESDTSYDLDNILILPTRNLVLFPEVSIPIKLVREDSLKIARLAHKTKTSIGIFCQKKDDIEHPSIKDLYTYGVMADVLQVVDLPDDTHMAIVRSTAKLKLLGKSKDMQIELPFASVKIVNEITPKPDNAEYAATVADIKSTTLSLLKKLDQREPSPLAMTLDSLSSDESVETINAVATYFNFETPLKEKLLAMYIISQRAQALLQELAKHEYMIKVAESVHQKARESFDDQQRRAFLQRQMEAIDNELNGEDSDIEELKAKADKVKMPDKIRETFDKELQKLTRYNPQSPDYSVQYSYLETLLGLPWGKRSELNRDFQVATDTLDHNHFGLEKVKERILEQIAVLINSPEGHAPILCLVGPPGVGKTSLGQSIADAMGRKYQRISLGGMHDEAEIRGHRRTYIGALPGRVIAAVQRAETVNPVLLLDEIDKLGQDYKGDPTSALLEVLDPEQNVRFHDNYIDVDFDLSEVLFIATANNISELPRPLLDRMEIIELSGYLMEEKVSIARQYLLPKVRSALNLDSSDFDLTSRAIETIIESYTSESGVRQLEKAITSLARKVLVHNLKNDKITVPVDSDAIPTLLGMQQYDKDRYENNDTPGVVTGLAWTAVGGEILFVETAVINDKAEKLTLTGNLGDVMKESATIALQYIKSHADELGLDPGIFKEKSFHIHVPEGAIPKDGPSAGITMATSILSALTQRKVKPRIAMTGEITLRGKVLPVGGIKEKILAAKRAGIVTIIISEKNRRHIEEIPEVYRNGLKFIYVNTVTDVFDNALEQ